MGLWRWLLLIMGATPPADEHEHRQAGAQERRGSRPLRPRGSGEATQSPPARNPAGNAAQE